MNNLVYTIEEALLTEETGVTEKKFSLLVHCIVHAGIGHDRYFAV